MAKKQEKTATTVPDNTSDDLPESRSRRSIRKTGSIKSWAITWVLAIFATQWGLLPLPEFAADSSYYIPFWVPVGMDTLRFIVLWVAAYIITQIIFGAWEILSDYYLNARL